MFQTVFAPHRVCLMFNQPLIWLNVVTDALVALAYYSIPAALFVVVMKKRDDIPLRPLLVLFGLFIAFCGGGHVMDIVSIWKPIYWFKGFWNAGTALTSVVTAIVLIPKVQGFIRLPAHAQKLEQEKQILQAVLDSVSEGILLADRAGRAIAYNPAAARILTGSAAPAQPPQIEWPGHSASDQDIQKTPDGRIIERFTRAIPGFGQLYVLRDITERRRSEELRLRLEHVIATMGQGFAIIPLDDETIQTPNAALAKMHGYAHAELAGVKAAALFSRNTLHTIREAAEREKFWEGEVLSARKDSSTFYSYVRLNLHEGEDHRFLSLLQRDIDEQKRMRAEAEKLQTKLLQAQKLESLGVLAGGVAHDFNNLLTGVIGNASLALDMLPPADPVKGCLEDVLKAAERAAQLTRQLLAYSGKGLFIVKPIDLSALAEETRSLVQLSIPRTVQCTLRTAANLPHIEADSSQIQQLLMNLVINAAEAIGDKTGTVLVSTGVRRLEAREIADDDLRPGPYVYVEVADNGCGMDEETKAQIFDPFFSTKFIGRGLGLAAAQGIVKAHHGMLKVTSTPGEGSTFQAFFPAWRGQEAMESRAASARDARGSGTVLVVDDEEPVRSATCNTLRHYGYKVLQAVNGAEAVEIFEKTASQITIVLLDMTMPVMSGEETLRLMQKIRPQVPVVLTSGFHESEALERFAGKGLSGFLQKPFTSAGLAEMVARTVLPSAPAGD